jgi:hypothetical protein
VVGVDRPTGAGATHVTPVRLVLELLGRGSLVAGAAQVLGVAVLVAAALDQRDDMVDYRGDNNAPTLGAVFAQAIGALKAAPTLRLASPATETLNHPLPFPARDHR